MLGVMLGAKQTAVIQRRGRVVVFDAALGHQRTEAAFIWAQSPRRFL